MEPNQWKKISQPRFANWHRQGHAGIAYDSKRGKIYLFGSDTHGYDWDNEVHEFDPVTNSWVTHDPRAPVDTYRADDRGRAVSGRQKLMPWAMHTYDNVVYDPNLDAIIVTALPEHNPLRKKIPSVKVHPTWIYDLKSRTWRIFENNGKPYPKFFAAGSAYDSTRDVVVGYAWGVWELGPDRREWVQATREKHHQLHFNMDYDSRNQALVVFGDYKGTSHVWSYHPGPSAGVKGQWIKQIPEGDMLPSRGSYPVAYDPDQGVFLLVVGPSKKAAADTYVYDLKSNVSMKIPEGKFEPIGMNFMMAYDIFNKVFLLVTGKPNKPAAVWAFKLDLNKLQRAELPMRSDAMLPEL